MADDRMKNDDLTREAGDKGGQRDDMEKGKQSPGRNPQGDQPGGGQRTGGGNQPGQQGGSGQGGRQGNQGGKGDMGQKR